MFLQSFQFQVQFRPGRLNGNADSLSRCALAVARVSDPDYDKIVKGEIVGPDSEYNSARQDMISEGDTVWIKTPKGRRKVVPAHKREELLNNVHQLGHFGTKKTFMLMRMHFWWPCMYRDVAEFVRCCAACQRRRPPPSNGREQDASFATLYPMQLICWDIMGPIPESRQGNKYMLVMVDAFSRWAHVTALKEASAETLSTVLWQFIATYGMPEGIHSDRGKNFTANVLQKVMELWGIKKSTSVAYFPQSNGLVERVNRTIQDILAKTLTEDNAAAWDTRIPAAVFAYNTIPHVKTEVTPHELFFGRLPKWPPAFINSNPPAMDDRFSTIRRIFDRTAERVQGRNRNADFRPGDQVMVYRPQLRDGMPLKFSLPWKGPYRVEGPKGWMRYRLLDNLGNSFEAHAAQMKRFHANSAIHSIAPMLRGRVFKPHRTVS